MTEGERAEMRLIRDALYVFINNMDKHHKDIDFRLTYANNRLAEIVVLLGEINKAMPNPLDVPE